MIFLINKSSEYDMNRKIVIIIYWNIPFTNFLLRMWLERLQQSYMEYQTIESNISKEPLNK